MAPPVGSIVPTSLSPLKEPTPTSPTSNKISKIAIVVFALLATAFVVLYFLPLKTGIAVLLVGGGLFYFVIFPYFRTEDVKKPAVSNFLEVEESQKQAIESTIDILHTAALSWVSSACLLKNTPQLTTNKGIIEKLHPLQYWHAVLRSADLKLIDKIKTLTEQNSQCAALQFHGGTFREAFLRPGEKLFQDHFEKDDFKTLLVLFSQKTQIPEEDMAPYIKGKNWRGLIEECFLKIRPS